MWLICTAPMFISSNRRIINVCMMMTMVILKVLVSAIEQEPKSRTWRILGLIRKKEEACVACSPVGRTWNRVIQIFVGFLYGLPAIVVNCLEDRLQSNIWYTLQGVLAVFTRITPPKMNRFGWNMKSGALWVHSRGRFWAVATAGDKGEIGLFVR